MIRISTVLEIDLVGDGASKEILIPLRAMRAPPPIVENAIPTGFLEATVSGPNNATLKMEGEFLRVTFANPVSATTPITLSLHALYGTDRIG